MKKILSYAIMISLFISVTAVPALARDRDTNFQEGQTFNWAPKYSTLSVDERVGLFYMDSTVEWDSTGANLVNNLLDAPNFYDYYAMDVTDTDSGTFGLGGTTSGYTNLPTGTWQAEDDNGDGLNDEVEYYWANEGLVAYYTYAFEPQFIKSQSSGSTTVQLFAQQGPLHQGYDWDYLRQAYVYWSDLAKISSVEMPDQKADGNGATILETDQETPNVYKVKVENDIVKTSVLLSTAEKANIDLLKAKQSAYLKQIDNEGNHPVTITFNPNIALDQAQEVLKENTESGGTFKYQAVQPDGVVGSGYFEDTPQGFSTFERSCSKHLLTNVNITGFIGKAKSKEAIEVLMNSSIVALTDISKPFVEKEFAEKYPGKVIKVYVPEQYVTMFPSK